MVGGAEIAEDLSEEVEGEVGDLDHANIDDNTPGEKVLGRTARRVSEPANRYDNKRGQK